MDDFTKEDIEMMNLLDGKNRMEIDEILAERERENGKL